MGTQVEIRVKAATFEVADEFLRLALIRGDLPSVKLLGVSPDRVGEFVVLLELTRFDGELNAKEHRDVEHFVRRAIRDWTHGRVEYLRMEGA